MKLPELLSIILISAMVCCGCKKAEPVAVTADAQIDHGEGVVVGADKTFLNNTLQAQTEAQSDIQEPAIEDTQKSLSLIGNILNSGIVCERDGWIYYSKKDDANRLYRIDQNGNREPVGTVTGAINLNVFSEGIVYRSGGIYMYDLQTDAAAQVVEGNCRNVFFNGQIIFYLKKTGDFYKMYSANLDGSGEKLLSENVASFMNVVDDSIYYIAGDDEGHIHRMNLDGSGDAVISSFGGVEELVVSDSIIYYISSSGSGYHLWRISVEGKDDREIYAKECHNINVSDHVIYFRESDRQMLCSIKDDGTAFQELAQGQCISINLTEEWIYFFNADDMNYYRVRKDGTDLCLVE